MLQKHRQLAFHKSTLYIYFRFIQTYFNLKIYVIFGVSCYGNMFCMTGISFLIWKPLKIKTPFSKLYEVMALKQRVAST